MMEARERPLTKSKNPVVRKPSPCLLYHFAVIHPIDMVMVIFLLVYWTTLVASSRKLNPPICSATLYMPICFEAILQFKNYVVVRMFITICLSLTFILTLIL